MSELKILQGKARAIIIPIFILVLGCASSTIGVLKKLSHPFQFLLELQAPWGMIPLSLLLPVLLSLYGVLK